jgi:hypothetical protein
MYIEYFTAKLDGQMIVVLICLFSAIDSDLSGYKPLIASKRVYKTTYSQHERAHMQE